MKSWLFSATPVKRSTFLTEEERLRSSSTHMSTLSMVASIIAITGEGTRGCRTESKKCKAAGATGALSIKPWLASLWFSKGAPQDRYKAIWENPGLQCIRSNILMLTKASMILIPSLRSRPRKGSSQPERRAQYEALVR